MSHRITLKWLARDKMKTRVDLTILTDPIPFGKHYCTEHAKRIGRRARNLCFPPPEYMRSKYRGHFAVTRSLVEGLRKIGMNFNYNPQRLTDVADVVIVLAGVATLTQAVELKRAGYVKRLLAGPNIVVFPSDVRETLCSPLVDLCTTPDDFTCKMYVDDCPELLGRCLAWPAGVDTSYWHPDPDMRNAKQILIYEKQSKGPVGPISEYLRILRGHEYIVEVMRYGEYLPSFYLKLLQHSSLMIGFSQSESQGIAWAEAWSTDVPMLSWYQEHYTYRGKTFRASPAPYLSAATGIFFSSPEEFEAALSTWETSRRVFAPRKWVMENMSDEVCARKLCSLAGVSVSPRP